MLRPEARHSLSQWRRSHRPMVCFWKRADGRASAWLSKRLRRAAPASCSKTDHIHQDRVAPASRTDRRGQPGSAGSVRDVLPVAWLSRARRQRWRDSGAARDHYAAGHHRDGSVDADSGWLGCDATAQGASPHVAHSDRRVYGARLRPLRRARADRRLRRIRRQAVPASGSVQGDLAGARASSGVQARGITLTVSESISPRQSPSS